MHAVFTSSVGKESAVTVAVLSVLPMIIGEWALIEKPLMRYCMSYICCLGCGLLSVL